MKKKKNRDLLILKDESGSPRLFAPDEFLRLVEDIQLKNPFEKETADD